MLRNIVKWYFNRRYRKHPPPMVRYWEWKNDAKLAKVTKARDGSYEMEIQNEKYHYPGFPRGHLLMASLSRLKHICKNRFFNDSWQKLEDGVPVSEIIREIKGPIIDEIARLTESSLHDMLPYEKMVPTVRELWRAATVVEETIKDSRRKLKFKRLKQCLCFVLQEDDAYRFRVQWMMQWFNPSSFWLKLTRFFTRRTLVDDFSMALGFMEHAEVVGDMKGKIRLLKRILLMILKDEEILKWFYMLCEELNWNKMKLNKADKYYFRGKYFKVDYAIFDY